MIQIVFSQLCLYINNSYEMWNGMIHSIFISDLTLQILERFAKSCSSVQVLILLTMSKQKQITGQKRSAPPATDYVAGQEPQHFGNKILSGEEIDRCQKLLAISCAQDELSTRKGAGNKKFTYMEAWKVIDIANNIFGYNGWSSQGTDTIIPCSFRSLFLPFLVLSVPILFIFHNHYSSELT